MILIKFIKVWNFRNKIWAITHGICSIHWQEVPVIKNSIVVNLERVCFWYSPILLIWNHLFCWFFYYFLNYFLQCNALYVFICFLSLVVKLLSYLQSGWSPLHAVAWYVKVHHFESLSPLLISCFQSVEEMNRTFVELLNSLMFLSILTPLSNTIPNFYKNQCHWEYDMHNFPDGHLTKTIQTIQMPRIYQNLISLSLERSSLDAMFRNT